MKKRKLSLHSRLVRLIVPFLFGVLTVYILNQMLSGERNMSTWHELREQVTDLKQENAVLKQQVSALEESVGRLEPGQLDEDYLEEKMREILPISRPNEEILLLNKR